MPAARSAVLALLLLAVALTLAGCTTLTDTPDTNNLTATETPLSIHTPTASPTPTPDVHPVTTPERYMTGDSNLGEHEEPHGIRIVNDRNETAANATIRITRDNADYTIEETYNLAPTEGHYGVLDYKANYTVTVIVGDQNASVYLSPSWFDCNDSTTTFTITEDDISMRTLTTTMGCPSSSETESK